MDQQPTSTPQKPSGALRKYSILAVLLIAIVVIVSSMYVILNPNGPETSTSAESASVLIGNSQVTPAIVTVKQGQAITWINDDTTPRKLVITSSSPQQNLDGFGSDEAILQNESYSYAFDTKGLFTYEDPSEPEKIKGTIIVE